jgi:PadR family transcriptional regulator PadR
MGDKQARIEILQGTLDLLILRTLRWGPTHGHGIATSIQQTSGDRLKIEHGSLYPALQRLLQEGWIEGHWGMSATGRKARFYRLTAAGRRQLTREQSKWREFTEAMGLVLGNLGPAGAAKSEE